MGCLANASIPVSYTHLDVYKRQAFSKMYNDSAAQIFVFFIMVVAAAEVAVGLAIIVMVYRKVHSVDVNILNRLKH